MRVRWLGAMTGCLFGYWWHAYIPWLGAVLVILVPWLTAIVGCRSGCHVSVPCWSGWWYVVLWLDNMAMSGCRMAGCHDWLVPCLLGCMLAKGVDTMMQHVCMLQWVLPQNRTSGAYSTSQPLSLAREVKMGPHQRKSAKPVKVKVEVKVKVKWWRTRAVGVPFAVVFYIFYFFGWHLKILNIFEDDGGSQSIGDMLPAVLW